MGDIGKLLIGAAIIAAVAVLIGVAIAYWWVWLALGAAGYGIYYFVQKQKDEANKV